MAPAQRRPISSIAAWKSGQTYAGRPFPCVALCARGCPPAASTLSLRLANGRARSSTIQRSSVRSYRTWARIRGGQVTRERLRDDLAGGVDDRSTRIAAADRGAKRGHLALDGTAAV